MLNLPICLGWKGLRYGLVGLLSATVAPMITVPTVSNAWAQVVPDTILGNEASTVIPTAGGLRLDGGAVRGTGIFHSFSEFNVEPGQQVYFANPADIANIFTRVTGSAPSAIDGTLGVDGLANLFLLNPNGIVFGDNAQLDVAGSFMAASIDSLWVDGYEFSAVQPDVPSPLLRVNVSPGIQYGANTSNSLLENRGTLAVNPQQNLTLLGGTARNLGTLIAPGGQVELSGNSVDSIGTVDTQLADGTTGTFFIDPKDIILQAGTPTSGNVISGLLTANNVVLQADNDITVDDEIISTSGNNLTLQTGRSIVINPNRSISLNGGDFTAQFNAQPVISADRDPGVAQFLMQPGSEILTNSGSVSVISGTFDQTSQIETTGGTINTTQLNGDGNDITLFALSDIVTGPLITGLQNPISPFLEPQTVNSGDISIQSQQGNIITADILFAEAQIAGGDITLDAANNLTILDNISTRGRTASGHLTFTGGNIISIIRDGDRLSVDTRIDAAGNPGNVLLTAPTVVLEDSIVVAINASDIQGGNVQVNANEVLLRNGRIATLALFGSGDAGDLTINTDRLTIIKEPGTFVTEGVGVATTASFTSLGDGGDITINATEFVDISADVPGPFVPTPEQILQAIIQNDTGIVASGVGRGSSGTISINTGRLSVREGSGLTTFSIAGQGGDIDINASIVELEGVAGFLTNTSLVGLNAGDLSIQAEQVELREGAFLGTATVSREGKAGSIDLSTQNLSLQDGSVISLATLGQGEGGQATIAATDLIEITGTSTDGIVSSGIQANSLGTGDAGTMEIIAGQLVVSNGGEITTETVSDGAGGDIDIVVDTLLLDDGRIAASSATDERGGQIRIQADESVELIGNGFNVLTEQIIDPALNRTLSVNNFTQGIVTIAAGDGAAGNVTIETPILTARDGALVSTTTLGNGTGGNIDITATNDLQIDGSLLATGSFTTAPSGDINLQTQRLRASGGAQAITTTFGTGQAGDLTVVATESVDLIDPTDTGIASGLLASSFETATGTGGNIQVTTGDFRIIDGATVTVSGEGQGDAGNIGIGARLLSLDRGNITATSASGEGGNIVLQIDDLLVLRNGSLISTTAGQAGAGGNGGNITVGDGFIIAIPGSNSDITANAFEGNGGRIAIATQGLLGINFRENLTPLNDITASSQFGLDGDVVIEQFNPDIEPTDVVLPDQLASADQITARCGAPANPTNSLITTGRGGLPTDPRQLNQGSTVLHDWRRPSESTGEITAPQLVHETLSEAQDWFVNDRGQVQLVASVSQLPANLKAPNCAASRGPV